MEGEGGAPRALLIDLDGVVRRWDQAPTSEAERLAGLPAGAVHRAAFAPELLLPAITGRLRDEEWRRQVAGRLQAEFPAADAALAVAGWSAPAGSVDQAVLALVRACRRRAAVVLITNATSRLDSDLERLGLTGEFDGLINSSAVGWAKPQPQIFEAALRLVGALPGQALFVDDTASHVAAARTLGLATHLYRDADELGRELGRRGLL